LDTLSALGARIFCNDSIGIHIRRAEAVVSEAFGIGRAVSKPSLENEASVSKQSVSAGVAVEPT